MRALHPMSSTPQKLSPLHPHEGVLQALLVARRSGQTAGAAAWRDAITSEAEAYAVQDALALELGWSGDGKPGFWKSGGPSRSAPMTHALLDPKGVRCAGSSLEDFSWYRPAVEAEIALRLGTEVTPEQALTLSAQDCAALVDAMAVTIEIADSRWTEGFDAPALLRLADSACHGALLVGDWVPYCQRDWSVQPCEVLIAGQEPMVRTGSHTLSDPLWLLPQWLRHLTRFGQRVPAGTCVTTGSWIGALAVAKVANVRVNFPGIGYASHVLGTSTI